MKRTLLFNILILGALLFGLNVISYLILKNSENNDQKKLLQLPSITKEYYPEVTKEFNSLETEYQPFVGWKRKAVNKKYTNIDKFGDRITIQDQKHKNKTIRFFGGSTMWGTGVEDSNTIPSFFEKCSDDYKIYNHGETGYNSRQSLARLINVLIKNDSVDIVVFYDGVNDIEHLCRKEIGIPGHVREVQIREELKTVNSTKSTFKGKDGLLGLTSKLLSKIFIKHTLALIKRSTSKSIAVVSAPYSCHLDENRATEVANHLLKNWEFAHQLTSSKGIKFLAILQPNIFLSNTQKDYVDLVAYGALEDNFKKVYEIVRSGINGYDWIYDFTEILDDESNPIYYDFCHINEKGNEIVAHQICEIISNLE